MESDEEADALPHLREGTLHRRGLSDSSIHSTFTSHADELPTPPNTFSRDANPSIYWPDQNSVFQALSRTLHRVRLVASGTMVTIGSRPSPSTPEVSSPQKPVGISNTQEGCGVVVVASDLSEYGEFDTQY